MGASRAKCGYCRISPSDPVNGANMDGLSLGIPGVGDVSSCTHFCALYSGPAERDRLLYPFLEEGLRQGDKCLVLIDDVEPALVRDRAVGQPGPGLLAPIGAARRRADLGRLPPHG